MPAFTLSGPVSSWAVAAGLPPRRYITRTLAYGDLAAMSFPTPFNSRTGEGEQRSRVEAHVRKLRREMAGGTFVPTTVTLGTRPAHRAALECDGEFATIEFGEDLVLPVLDGQQRMGALAQLLKEREADGDADGADLLRALPVPVVVLLDGDPKADFLRLQLGKAVDPTTLSSLKLATGMVTGKNAEFVGRAFAVARVLNAASDSPFQKLVKFDSQSMAPLSVTTLCARGASDLSTSLVGLSIVCPDAHKAAAFVCLAHEILLERVPHLLEEGKFLTPPPDGTRGSATMLVGVAVGLAHLCAARGEPAPGEDTAALLARVADSVFDEAVNGNISGPAKRQKMGEFIVELFEGEDVAKHDDVPLVLVEELSASCFGAVPLPKTAKPKASKPKAGKGKNAGKSKPVAA